MSNALEFSTMPPGTGNVLWQLFRNGPTFDGDLVSKRGRDWLVEKTWAFRAESGYNSLTRDGIAMALSLGMGDRKMKERYA